jgi:hypothetical protein
MTLKSYLWGMKLGTLISIVGFSLVVYYVDPRQTGILGQILFYLVLFLSVSGIFTLILTGIRRNSREDNKFIYLGMSLRQGLLLGLLVIILLLLQSLKYLTWWDGLLTVAAIFLVELYFLSR